MELPVQPRERSPAISAVRLHRKDDGPPVDANAELGRYCQMVSRYPTHELMSAESPALFTWKLRRWQLVCFDVVVAAVYLLILATYHSFRPGSGDQVPLWAALTISATMTLPLAVRRMWPKSVFAIVLGGTVACLVVDIPDDSFIAAAFALYVVALHARAAHRSITTVIGVATLGGAGLLAISGSAETVSQQNLASVMVGAVLMGAAWTIGIALRDRRVFANKAARRLADDLVTQEKLHIARELHDVVAHSMSLIAVKSSVANHVAAKRPQEALHALEVIEATSKDALTQMRQILGVLRDKSESEEPALQPTPRLVDLPQLVDRAAMAAVKIDTEVTNVDDLPAGVDMSAYRIVQEAVTNVIKHAAPAHCHIAVIGGNGELSIEVVDDGPGKRRLPSASEGHGLVGMAERVAVYGGKFLADKRSSGGFAVSATIPYTPHAATESTNGARA